MQNPWICQECKRLQPADKSPRLADGCPVCDQCYVRIATGQKAAEDKAAAIAVRRAEMVRRREGYYRRPRAAGGALFSAAIIAMFLSLLIGIISIGAFVDHGGGPSAVIPAACISVFCVSILAMGMAIGLDRLQDSINAAGDRQ